MTLNVGFIELASGTSFICPWEGSAILSARTYVASAGASIVPYNSDKRLTYHFVAVGADRSWIVTFWGQHWIEYFEVFLVDRTRG